MKLKKAVLALYLLFLAVLPVQAEFISIFDFSGGLNNKIINTEIPDNCASAIQNINLSYETKSFRTRAGYVCVSTNTITGAYEVKGIYDYQQADGDNYLIVASSNTIKKLATDGITWNVLTPSSDVSAGSLDYYDFCVFVDTCIITNGADVPMKYYGDTSLYDIGTGTDPDDRRPNFAQFVERYHNRLWFSGKMQEADGGVAGSTVYNWVRYSGDYGAPNTFEGADAWPADWVFKVDDEKVTGLKSFNGALVVFGLKSISDIRGEMYASDNGFVLRKVLDGVGCVHDRTIVEVDNILYFMDITGHIYSYDGSTVQLRSDAITTTINGLNKAILTRACGAYFPKFHQIWWAVATGSASANDTMLVYDTLYNNWTVYDGIDASAMALREVSGEKLLYTGGSSDGYIYRMNYGESDYPANVQTAINAYYSTKYFPTYLKEQEVVFDSAYLTLLQSGNWDVTVKTEYDFGRTQSLTLINLNPGGSLWDTMVWDTDTWAGEDTYMIKKIDLSKAGNFIRLTFSNANIGEPFQVYSARIKYRPLELR